MSPRFGLLLRGLLGQAQRQKLDWKNLLAAALKNTVSIDCDPLCHAACHPCMICGCSLVVACTPVAGVKNHTYWHTLS
jgi:hypothetical protein